MSQKCIIVGAGHVGIDYHLPVYQSITGVDVVAICEPSQNRAQSVLNNYDINNHYNSLDLAFEDNKFDLVSICTPPEFHFEQIKKSLNNNCNVLVTKPTVANNEELEKLNKIMDDGDYKLTTSHPLKYKDSFMKATKSVRHNSIGDLKHIHINKIFNGSKNRIVSSSNHWAHNLTASYWTESMSHQIYAIYQFYNNIQLSEVKVHNKQSNYPGVQVDEFSVLLNSPDGSASLRYSANGNKKDITHYFIGDKNTIKYDGVSVRRDRELLPKKIVADTVDAMTRRVNKISYHFKYHLTQGESSGPDTGHKRIIKKFVKFANNESENPVPWDESYTTTKIVNEISNKLANTNGSDRQR